MGVLYAWLLREVEVTDYPTLVRTREVTAGNVVLWVALDMWVLDSRMNEGGTHRLLCIPPIGRPPKVEDLEKYCITLQSEEYVKVVGFMPLRHLYMWLVENRVALGRSWPDLRGAIELSVLMGRG